MDDKTWERIEAKRQRAAYFRDLDRAAEEAAKRKPLPQPKPPRMKPPKQWPKPIGPKPAPRPRKYQRIPEDQWKPIPGRPVTRPKVCQRCRRPFRPRKTRIEDYPRTVYHVGHGLCRTCEKHR